MQKSTWFLVLSIICLLMLPSISNGQQASEPKYKDGDWWRVKSEFEVKDPNRSGGCQDSYKEWVVKIEKKGLAHIYGIKGNKEEEGFCDAVLGWVFGVSNQRVLKFPLSVGKSWTHQYETGSSRRPVLVKSEYKVLAWEKVQTPKGTFDAFRISTKARWVTGRGDERFIDLIEFYSPKVKAIISSDSETATGKRKVRLVDFNVGE